MADQSKLQVRGSQGQHLGVEECGENSIAEPIPDHAKLMALQKPRVAELDVFSQHGAPSPGVAPNGPISTSPDVQPPSNATSANVGSARMGSMMHPTTRVRSRWGFDCVYFRGASLLPASGGAPV